MAYTELAYGNATHVANKADRRLYRLLELQPGIFAWATLVAVVAASYWIPAWAAIFIIGLMSTGSLTIYLSVHMNHSFHGDAQKPAAH